MEYLNDVYIIFLYILSAIISCNGAKILAVFPATAISHQISYRPLTHELAKRGHDVTVITTDPAFSKDNAPKNLKEIDIHFSYNLWPEVFLSISEVGEASSFSCVKKAFEAVIPIYEFQMMSDEVQQLLNGDNKFDLLIIEACIRPALVFTHKYKAPVILVNSFGAFHGAIETLSGPFHPILHPDVYQTRFHNLTIWEKIQVHWTQYKLQNIITDLEEAENAVGRKMLGSEAPRLSVLTNNVDLLFLNIPVLWDNMRPTPPGLLHLGGLQQHQQKGLPKDLQSYLDSSNHGFIYVSFGTNVAVSQIPKDKRDILIKVFSQLPYNFVCKWDEVVPDPPKNIMFRTWYHQEDVLKHPNIKLFITQGGLQSAEEAITAGVPLLVIPMIADQWFNTAQYTRFGIAKDLNIDMLTEEDLFQGINEVIKDESYRRNIARFRSLVNDKPQSSLDRAVWWTEYLLRHGGKHLRSPAANMSLAEYLELELISVLIIFVLLLSLLLRFLICVIIKCLVRLFLKKCK